MHYTITRLRGVRMAAVLVDRHQLAAPYARTLLAQLQAQLQMPVMLVARDDGNWKGARALADFDATPYLHALLSCDDLDWNELRTEVEPELPF